MLAEKESYIFSLTNSYNSLPPYLEMAQKVVLKIMTMNDEKTKQKAIEEAADIYGVDSIAADLKEQKLTIIGGMDAVAIAKKLKCCPLVQLKKKRNDK